MNDVHHPELAALLREEYTREEFAAVEVLLHRWGTLDIAVQANGLTRAVPDGGRNELSGYHRVWVRDAVQVAHSFWRCGEGRPAVAALRTLLEFHARSAARFEAVLRDPSVAADPMQRPHIRFDGDTLEEVDERWAHAQNDALGYALWLAARMWSAGDFAPTSRELAVLEHYVRFFAAVEYWHDRDSGHWEENRAVHASSIGVVVAALEALARVDAWPGRDDLSQDALRELATRGRDALEAILPEETIGERETDAALLFLLAPLDLLEPAQARAVLQRVLDRLMGPFGVKRYEGDSYWCADYRELLDPSRYSSDYSFTTAERDRLLKPGTEAQWCIFDPVLSVWYGWQFRRTGHAEDHRRQVWHLNRALAQVTGPGEWCAAGSCPEAYFLASSREGVYRPNDQTPLAWTQANLRWAMAEFAASLR